MVGLVKDNVKNSNIFEEYFHKVFKESINTKKIKATCKSYMEVLHTSADEGGSSFHEHEQLTGKPSILVNLCFVELTCNIQGSDTNYS